MSTPVAIVTPGLPAALLAAVAHLHDRRARLRFVAGHAELRTPEGLETLRARALELTAVNPRQALATAEMAVSAARHLGVEARLKADRARAQALDSLCRYADSALAHRELAAAYTRRGDSARAAGTMMGLSAALMYAGDGTEALAVAARARTLYRRLGDRQGLAKLEVNVATIEHRLDRFRASLARLDRVRPVFVRAGDRASTAIIDLNRGLSWSMLGESGRAQRLYSAAACAFSAEGRELQVAIVDYNRAYDLYLAGRYDRAYGAMEEVGLTYRRLGFPHGVASVDLDLAEMSLRLGANLAARDQAARARAAFADLGIDLEEARAASLEGVALHRLGEIDEARARFAAARACFQRQRLEVRAALDRKSVV